MDLLEGTHCLFTHGVVYKHQKEKDIKCYVGTNFSNVQDQKDADNTKNVVSYTGNITIYTEYPLLRLCNMKNKLI